MAVITFGDKQNTVSLDFWGHFQIIEAYITRIWGYPQNIWGNPPMEQPPKIFGDFSPWDTGTHSPAF